MFDANTLEIVICKVSQGSDKDIFNTRSNLSTTLNLKYVYKFTDKYNEDTWLGQGWGQPLPGDIALWLNCQLKNGSHDSG
jgi:hypothetical protein